MENETMIQETPLVPNKEVKENRVKNFFNKFKSKREDNNHIGGRASAISSTILILSLYFKLPYLHCYTSRTCNYSFIYEL